MAALNTTADAFVHLGDYVGQFQCESDCAPTDIALNTTYRLPRFGTSRSMNLLVMGTSLVRRQTNKLLNLELFIRRAKIGRKTLGRELATIFDYRQRLNQYRTDVGLRTAHETGPWITVW